MNAPLPTTGTAALLAQLSDFVPDDFIRQMLPPHRGQGWRAGWSSAQLFRLLLLVLLTPAHSFNLLVELLPEQRAWAALCPAAQSPAGADGFHPA